MKNAKKVIGLVLLCLLAVFPIKLFASGQQDTGTSSGKVTIQYWVAADPARLAVYKESIKEFEKANPGINVDMQQEVGDDVQVQQKISAQLAAGNAPQVVHIDTMYVKDMANAGRLTSLSQFAGSKELAGAFYPAVENPLIVNRNIYGYPIRANTIELIVNNKILKDCGIDPKNPASDTAELKDAAIKATKKDSSGHISRYGFGPSFNKDSHWTVHAFSPFLWSNGGVYVDYAKKTAGWAGQAGVKTLSYFNDLINGAKVSPAYDIDNGFQSGRMAMWINGEWQIQGFHKDFPNLDYSFHTIPTAKAGQKPILPLGGRALTIPKGSKNLKQAWKLIQWVTSKKEQMRYTRAMVGLTPRKDVLDDPWFNDHPNYKVVQEDMQFVRAKYAPQLLEMDTILYDAIQKTLINGVPADKALQAGANEYNKILRDALSN